MKRFFLVILSLTLCISAFAQSRRLGSTRSQASQERSEVLSSSEPNYDPVITNLGKVLDVEDNFAYVKISNKYDSTAEGYYYFYACNIQAKATAILEFEKEYFRDVFLMKIKEGTCEKGDYVYLRFVPKVPLDVLLPF